MKQSLVKSPRSYFVVVTLTLIAAFVLWASVLHVSASANLHVTNTNDSGAGSLRQAILDANASPADDEIDFQIPGCVAATPCTITLTSGELAIANNGLLTITGPGSNVVSVSGNNQSRVFNISAGSIVNISGITIKNGKTANGAAGPNINGAGNGGSGADGGGIYNDGGNLTLTNCTVTANSTGSGGNGNNVVGGAGGNGGNGAGIYTNGGMLNLNNTSVSGNVTGNGGLGLFTAANGGTGGNGGGIYNNAGTLSFSGASLSGNVTGAGGGGGSSCDGCLAGSGGRGGDGAGIYSFNGSVILNTNTILGNHTGNGGAAGSAGDSGRGGSGGNGAGIYNNGSSLTITATSISSNSIANSGDNNNAFRKTNGITGGSGGGIFNTGTADITSTTINNNSSGRGGDGTNAGNGGGAGGTGGSGGGLFNQGTLKLTNSTVSNNISGAGGNGGTCLLSSGCSSGVGGSGGSGGGILNAGTATLNNDTIANNTANGGGSGLSAGAGGNGGGFASQSGTANLRNTIIANNGAVGIGPDVLGTFTSSGHNFIGKSDGSGGFVNGSNGDQVGTSGAPKNPLISATLQDNGGPTLTMALSSASTAKDAGDNCVLTANGCGDGNPAVTTDQRGVTRPQGPTVDIGAVEVTVLTVTINQAAGQADPTGVQPVNFTVAFNEDVTGFGSSGVSLAGSTASVGSATIVVTGGPKTYNVAISNVGPGVLQASILAGAAADTAGNLNLASTSTDNQITLIVPVINLVVNKTADTNDGSCDIADCSLREAITTANNTFGVKNITFNLPGCFPSSPCTVGLTGGTMTVANNGAVTITGLGASSLTINANNTSRIFIVDVGASLSLSDMTLTGGRGDNSDGGALYNNQGTLNLTSCVVTGNLAGKGGTGANFGGTGGAGPNGGGIFNNVGITNITNSTFSFNTAGTGGDGGSFGGTGGIGGSGGGIFNNGGTLTIIGSTFNNNAGGFGGPPSFFSNGVPNGSGGGGGHGGAIFNTGTVVIANSTLSGNSGGTGHTGGGGGKTGGSGGSGGGIFNNGGTLTIVNATITNNTAGTPGMPDFGSNGGSPGSAGGIWRAAGTVNTRNTIIAGNTVPTGGTSPDVLGALSSLGHNLIGKSDGSTGFTNGSNGDQVGTIASPRNPLIGPLQNNGGPTQTHAQLGGSTTVDTGDNCVLNQSCPTNNLTINLTTDQRSVGRPKGATVDIGAVELTPLTVTINQAAAQADPAKNLPINFTVVFSESVSDFTNADVSLAGSSANVSAANIAVTGSGTTYNVAVSNVTSDGTVVASIPVNAATDATGNASAPSTSTDNVVTFDTTRPGVTINQANGQADPTSVQPINFTVVFSEPVISFTGANVSLAGTTANISTVTVTVTGTGPTYNVAISNILNAGLVQVSIPANVVTDPAGNGNTASTSTDNQITLTVPVTNLVVNTLGDAGDGVCDASCTLRDAVTTANNTGGVKNISFDLPACTTGSPCTITLTNGQLAMAANGPVFITGPGNNVLSITGNYRIFYISPSLFFSLTDVTITGGVTEAGVDSPCIGCLGGPAGNGAGIYNDGTAVLTNLVIAGNVTGKGGNGGLSSGTAATGGNGAGIYTTGTLTLTNSTVRNNTTGPGGSGGNGLNGTKGGNGGEGGGGAGIYNSGTLTVIGCTINNNHAGPGNTGGNTNNITGGNGGAGGKGGGIYNNNGTVTLVNNTISDNLVDNGGVGGNGPTGGNGGNGGEGGGVYNIGGTINLVNNTLSNNITGGGGAGGFNFNGGGFAVVGTLGSGGGIRVASGTVNVRNNIVANNGGGFDPDVSGAVSSQGHNFISRSDGSTGLTNGSNGDQAGTSATPIDPLLGPLQDNSGPTFTRNIDPTSPAKDAGDNCVLNHSCSTNTIGFNLTNDQRLVTRPQGATVDIGAVEQTDVLVNPVTLPAAILNTAYSQTITGVGGTGSYTFAKTTGTLPNGVTLSAAGLLSGTPTQAGTFSFMVTATDTNSHVGSRAYTLLVDTPPSITPIGVTRAAGSVTANFTVANVSDIDQPANTLSIKVNAGASATVNGVTVSNLSIGGGGAVTADVTTGCGAITATFSLTTTDSSNASTSGNLTVTVNSDPGPTLTYNNQTMSAGGSLTINPATGPSDNGAVSTIAVQSQGTYTGTINVNNTTGIVSISGAQPVGTHTITIRATDGCGGITDASFTLTVNGPTITSLNPSSTQQNSSNVLVTVNGTNFVPGSVIVYNGSNHATTFGNGTTLTMTLSASDTAVAGTKTVTVVNSPGAGGTSNSVLFTIDPAGICNSQSVNVSPGGTGHAAVMPSGCGPNGVDATYTRNAGASGDATLYTASYQSNPTGSSIFNVGGGFVDLKVTPADSGDTLTAVFYYPATITGLNEIALKLFFYNGTNWQAVKGSGGLDPAKNTADNQNGTTSGGTFTLAFDATSTPQITQLTGTVFTTSTVATPTAVDFDSATVTQVGNSALIEWKTGMEINNLGFNVYRESNGQRIQINPSLIAGCALLFGLDADLRSGFTYAWSDDTADASAGYWIEDIDLNGTSTWHGPFGISGSSSSTVGRAKSALLTDLATNAARQANSVIQREYAADTTQASNNTQAITNGRTPSKSATVPASLQRQWQIAQQNAVKIAINKTGWYKVNASDLFAAGLVNSGPDGLRMYVGGNEIPIKVNSADGVHFDSIEFYGVGLDSPTSDTQVYWLTSGDGSGKRINVQTSPGGNASNGPTSFQYTVERKDRSLYFSSLRNGDAENWFGPIVNSNAVSQTISIHNQDATDVAQAQIEIALQGVTTNAHQVTVSLNGQALNTTTFDGMEHHVLKLSVPQSSLIEGNNQITFAAAGSGDVSLIDYVRVTYAHTYTAESNTLNTSITGVQPVKIGGFTSNDIRAIDVVNANQPVELEGTIEGDSGNYSISVNGAKRRNLLVFTPDKVLQPLSITANNPGQLSNASNGADFVIITSKDFASSVQPLAALRQSQGYQVSIIDIDNVYDEFSYGVHSPYAVRDFLSWTYTHWRKQPQFVMLAGSATIDPRNYIGVGSMDFVPTKLIDTASMETASDDWFVDFNGDGKPQMSIGRLPVHTASEASIVVNKILAYEQSGPTQGVTLVSDLNDGIDFNLANNQIKTVIPTNLSVVNITRSQNVAEAKTLLLEQLNQGGRIVNYAGHGSVNLWRGGLLSASDMASLANHQTSPLVVTMTCLNGYFQDPKLASLGESLLKVNNGGAVSVWASSGMTDSGNQSVMNQAFFRQLFGNPTITLGEAIKAAKSATDDNDIRRTWILFGDPTIRIK